MRRGAFTLVELVATLVVLGMLAVVTAPMLMESVEGYAAASGRAQLHTEASLAMERMTRELRNIAPAGEGPEPRIDEVTGTSITFNDDERLWLEGSALRLRVEGVEAVLATDVAWFELEAFDESDEVVALPVRGAATEDVRRLRVSITLAREGVSERLEAKVFLRAGMSAGEGA